MALLLGRENAKKTSWNTIFHRVPFMLSPTIAHSRPLNLNIDEPRWYVPQTKRNCPKDAPIWDTLGVRPIMGAELPCCSRQKVMLLKSYECSLAFPHWKLAYRTISSIVQLQAGILSPSYFKKIKEPGVFMKEQVKNHRFSGWLFIFPIFENHGYTAELNLSFENCNLSISRITLITARGLLRFLIIP
jgi:hypothetical protein